MVNKFSNTIKSLNWILIFLLIGAGTLSNITVCLEDNGQMEIACDCPFSSPPEQTSNRLSEAGLFHEHADRCDPCIDISFSLKSVIPIHRTQQKVFDVNPLAAFFTSNYLTSPINVINTEISYYSSPEINFSLSSLRTVVLLI